MLGRFNPKVLGAAEVSLLTEMIGDFTACLDLEGVVIFEEKGEVTDLELKSMGEAFGENILGVLEEGVEVIGSCKSLSHREDSFLS